MYIRIRMYHRSQIPAILAGSTGFLPVPEIWGLENPLDTGQRRSSSRSAQIPVLTDT